MDTLAHQLGKSLIARGTVAAISRWGVWRVAGFVGAAVAVAWYLAAHRKSQASATSRLSASEASGGAAARTADEERRRTPEVETGAGYPEGTRTLH